MSPVVCHVSCVMFHVSCFMCHRSPVTLTCPEYQQPQPRTLPLSVHHRGRYATPLATSESEMLATNLRSSKVLVALLEGLKDAGDVLENLKDAGGGTRGTWRQLAKLRTLKMPAVHSRVLETTAILEGLLSSLPQPRHDLNILWKRILQHKDNSSQNQLTLK